MLRTTLLYKMIKHKHYIYTIEAEIFFTGKFPSPHTVRSVRHTAVQSL